MLIEIDTNSNYTLEIVEQEKLQNGFNNYKKQVILEYLKSDDDFVNLHYYILLKTWSDRKRYGPLKARKICCKFIENIYKCIFSIEDLAEVRHKYTIVNRIYHSIMDDMKS